MLYWSQMVMDALDKKLLNRIQNDFPLVATPFSKLGEDFGLTEAEIIARLSALRDNGTIRSISAVLDPERLGLQSVLVAARVVPEALEAAANTVNALPEVTHNYARDDEFNLWFTITAPSPARIQQIVDAISALAGVERLEVLPALRKFKLYVQFEPPEAESI
jgi:siroheme decarboxylase